MTKNENINDSKLKKKDLIHIELLRIIAIYLVLFNHTGTNGFFLFSVTKESSMYWIYLFISIIDKVAVPLFFMISGALLLGKEESILDVYKKRIVKFIIILMVISFCYYVYDSHFNNLGFGIKDYLIGVYSKNVSVGLWYLYSYIGTLIMLPLLRKLANAMSDKEYIYLTVCYIVIIGVIPIIQYLFSKGAVSLNRSFSASLITATNIFYVLIGYYVEKKLNEKYFNKKNVCIGLIASFIAISICCFMTYYRAIVMGVCREDISQAFHNSLIAIPTITIYFSVKYFFKNRQTSIWASKLIQFLGETTFGIYLMEKMLRDRTNFIFSYLKPRIHTLPACIIWIAAACLLGSIITAILKRMPIIKKWI